MISPTEVFPISSLGLFSSLIGVYWHYANVLLIVFTPKAILSKLILRNIYMAYDENTHVLQYRAYPRAFLTKIGMVIRKLVVIQQ